MKEIFTWIEKEESIAENVAKSIDENTIERGTKVQIQKGSKDIKGKNEIMKLLLAKFKEPKK